MRNAAAVLLLGLLVWNAARGDWQAVYGCVVLVLALGVGVRSYRRSVAPTAPEPYSRRGELSPEDGVVDSAERIVYAEAQRAEKELSGGSG